MPAHAHDDRSERNIRTAFFLNLAFTLFEFVGGAYTGSLAITADALHDLGDSFALGLSWFFERVARRERTPLFSYGYRRFSLLAALINAVILVTGSIVILAGAIPRIFEPSMPDAAGMFVFALIGIAANGLAALRVRGGATLNERVVAWHLLEDVMGWVAVLVVSIVLLFWEIPVLDPVLAVLIALFVLWNVGKNLRQTVVIFLQGVPPTITIGTVREALTAINGGRSIHDTHLWSLDGEHHILTTHIVVAGGGGYGAMREIKCRAKEAAAGLGISHATIEIEQEGEGCPVAGGY
ncbi:cation transporter [Methanoculleus sp. FWC-SCC1]|uniref:Cation transporter n=1 Tax=Methanoculleus frigidifontis TaxID=2584085 RepID=A0ABT8MD29_9EURY|nr:cation diffusion facilitator family transporter [Methanoculleus sp. FWC-SCC1]MDN7025841.1 cation transporter [Methanoculleus sp. FWC-SCC1]